MHRVVDANTQEIVAAELAAKVVVDAEVVPDMLKPLPDNEAIATLAGDGAYDTENCHQAITARQAQALIPPRAGAVEWPDHEDGSIHLRTIIVRACSVQGESEWKRISGYHRRSWVETATF